MAELRTGSTRHHKCIHKDIYSVLILIPKNQTMILQRKKLNVAYNLRDGETNWREESSGSVRLDVEQLVTVQICSGGKSGLPVWIGDVR